LTHNRALSIAQGWIFASGDIIETSGFNIIQIDHAGYIQESAKHGYRIAF
jgi:hypothetical protein